MHLKSMHLLSFPCLWVKLVTNIQAVYGLLFVLQRANSGLPPSPTPLPKYQDACLYSSSNSDIMTYVRKIKGFLEYHGFLILPKSGKL